MAIAETASVNILCVDDESGLTEVVCSYLEQSHNAITAVPKERVDEALTYFEKHDVDAIVSDFEMPEMNGLDFLEVIRERDSAIPFVLYTGKGSEEIASEAISKGVTEYMQKETGTDQYSVLANRVLNAVEQYRTEEELHEERARFQAVFEEASDAMIIADDDGTFLNVNSAACALFDRPEEDLLGRATTVFTNDDFETAWESFKETRMERGRCPVERPDGTVAVAEYTASTDIMPGTHLSVLRDITERREYERKLTLQKERLNEFAGVLSHDLQNPVQVAQGRIDLLLNGVDPDDRAQHLEATADAITRIDHVIRDVLAISRENSLSRERTDVALSDLAAEVWHRVNAHGTDPNIEPGIVVTADEGRFERLLTNLFRNSIEHGSETVTIGVGRLEGEEKAGFFVEDDGPGIPKEAREEVFDWHHSTKDGGTGIGLKSVKQITEAEGWTVSISNGNHGGARFEFCTTPPE